MFGWDSAATARASRWNRDRDSGSFASRSARTLIATSRSSRVSRARYTSPIPPAPSGPRISYGPRRELAESVISGSRRQVDQNDVGVVTQSIEQDLPAVGRDVEAL